MPTFDKSASVDVEIDVSVEDFYYEMNDHEREEMAKLLKEDGFLSQDLNAPSGRVSWKFDEAILKLKRSYYSLSNQEVEQIIHLAKRF